MKKVNFKQYVKSVASKAKFGVQKHSPEILIFAGIAGTIVSTVIACKKTKDLNNVIEPAKEDLEDIHRAEESGVTDEGNEYTKIDAGKELLTVYGRTGLALLKLYSPAITIEVLSITSIVASNKIMRRRSAELAAAYMAVDQSFKEYRKRVIDKFGDETDRELKYGAKMKKVTETEIDEDGNEKKVKKTKEVIDPYAEMASPYTYIFDKRSRNWESNPDYDMWFLQKLMDEQNNELKAEGHKFLCEYLKEADIKEDAKSHYVGWLYDPNDDSRDSKIDVDITKEADCDGDPVFLLDFNVDGAIIDDFEKYDWRNRDNSWFANIYQKTEKHIKERG